MLGIFLCLLSDTSAVDIRALVSQDINKAAHPSTAVASQTFAERLFGVPEYVLAIELALILIMAGLFIAMVVRFRRLTKEQKQKVAAAQKMSVKLPPAISKIEIERILNQIASEKQKEAEITGGNYYVDYSGKLDSGEAIHEMARTHHLESGRLNFAISTASQFARQDGTKFKEAFTLVSEDSDLNILARQLNMGKGELELILALKRSKIANSRKLAGGAWRREE